MNITRLLPFLQAYKTSWGLKCPGAERGKLINKLADLIEKNIDEFAAWETLNTGSYCALTNALKDKSKLTFYREGLYVLKIC